MGGRFRYFVILAGMRTGSNFLEETLNLFPDLACHGELFNPSFIGHHRTTELWGFDLARRERDPYGLIEAMIAAEPERIPGFRLFHDHDPRIIEHVLADPACAKVVLNRNVLDSYVSRKIALATGQWRVTHVSHRRAARIHFVPEEFQAELAERQAFQLRIQRALQLTGQAAFWIHYDDLGDVEVINGLGAFLGSEHRIEAVSRRLKRQNPGGLREKVANYDEMRRALAAMDLFDLDRTPNFEPRRGPAVPGYVAGNEVPVLWLPLAGGPGPVMRRWLAALEPGGAAALIEGMNQKALRRWKRARPGHVALSVVRHPAPRALAAFAALLADASDSGEALRRSLAEGYGVPAPDPATAGRDELRAAFAAFLDFLRANLLGQTGVWTRPAWATQSALVQGFAQVAPPHRILREEEIGEGLAQIAEALGRPAPPVEPEMPMLGPWRADQIIDE
ncbi:MAG: nodulation protein NodH, partial [Alphaproteobacteria bacterium]